MMNRDYILSLIGEMAQAEGLDERDFVEQLYAQRTYEPTDGLPEGIAQELNESRKQKSDERYKAAGDERMKNDIQRFRTVFPDVNAEGIPESVWQSVCEGVPLTAAYALFEKESSLLGAQAKKINESNAAASPSGSERSEAVPFVSIQQLEKMSPSEVKKNYRQIIASMKKWKI